MVNPMLVFRIYDGNVFKEVKHFKRCKAFLLGGTAVNSRPLRQYYYLRINYIFVCNVFVECKRTENCHPISTCHGNERWFWPSC